MYLIIPVTIEMLRYLSDSPWTGSWHILRHPGTRRQGELSELVPVQHVVTMGG